MNYLTHPLQSTKRKISAAVLTGIFATGTCIFPSSAFFAPPIESEEEEETISIEYVPQDNEYSIFSYEINIPDDVNVETPKKDTEIDPLSNDILDVENINPFNTYSGANVICHFKDYLEQSNVPFTFHENVDYSKIDEKALRIIKKTLAYEAGNCCFELQTAIAALFLNRLSADDFPDNAYDIVTAENQFNPEYGVAPWPEEDEKINKAIELALCGVDFSCNAKYYYNPEISSPIGIAFFEECTTELTSIWDPFGISVFTAANYEFEEASNGTRYIYSPWFDAAIACY